MAQSAQENGDRCRAGGQIEDARVPPGIARLGGEARLPACVPSKREGARQDVVARRDTVKDGFRVPGPVARILGPGVEPGGQIANQYVIFARTLFSGSVRNRLPRRMSLLNSPGAAG